MRVWLSTVILVFAVLFMSSLPALSQQPSAPQEVSQEAVSWGQSLSDVISSKMPVGRIAKQGFDWFKTTFAQPFNMMRLTLDGSLRMVQNGLLWPPPWLFILALGALSYFLKRDWRNTVLTVLGFAFILNQGYWKDTMESLSLLIWSFAICMGFGVPIGIYAAHHPRLYRAMQPVLDMMQVVPSFVYLLPGMALFRIGMVPGLIATVIFVIPIAIRLTEQGISATPRSLKEAGEAFGASPRQQLWKVELPFALPLIRAAMTQTILLSLSMVVIAAAVGANGLGKQVYVALQRNDVALGFESGLVIVVVAIVLDRLFRPQMRR